MLRALATAVAALRQAGIEDPAKHIIMIAAKAGNFSSMLVKKASFHLAGRAASRACWTA
jgi:hypothetical protein